MMNLYTTLTRTPQEEEIKNEVIKCVSETSSESCQVSESASIASFDLNEIEAQKHAFMDRMKLDGQNPTLKSIPSYPGKTRTTDTEQEYLRRGHNLVVRYQKSYNREQVPISELNPVHFVEFIFTLKPSWKNNTWQRNRECVLMVIPLMSNAKVEEAIDLLRQDNNTNSETLNLGSKQAKISRSVTKKTRPQIQRTRVQKVIKEVKFEFFAEVLNKLFELGTKRSKLLINWLVAGISTGLRPVEWMSTELIEVKNSDPSEPDQLLLFVANAKATNARANGPMRILDVTNFHYTTIDAIQAMIVEARGWRVKGNFESVHKNILGVLSKVIDSLNTNRRSTTSRNFTLYSLRHQFASNMRKVSKPGQVSDLMGHGSLKSEKKFYGKRSGGWKLKQIVDIPTPVLTEQHNLQLKSNLTQKVEPSIVISSSPKLGM